MSMPELKMYEGPETPTKAWEGHIKFSMTAFGLRAVAVYPDGKYCSQGCLFRLQASGMYLYGGINSDLDLPLDEKGRLEVVSLCGT